MSSGLASGYLSKASASANPSEIVAPVVRNQAVDAYRGLVMLLMMGEVLSFSHIAKAYPTNLFWAALAYNQSHVEWVGCSLHDLIQPSFSFLVGVALPYSIASRVRRGVPFTRQFLRVLGRSLVLIALGIFLRSMHSPQTNFTFEDTLTQIGLGYPFLFLLGYRSARWQWGAFVLILFSYWLAWALYPAGAAFDANWHHNLTGFAAHWNKDSNLGNAFDRWFLNLFPRPKPFVTNGGGYLTLSFIPTLATMLLGLVAGRWLRAHAPAIPLKRFLMAGAIGVTAGLLFHSLGICPIVKRIWTPSWVLFSGGACFLILAGFSWLMEVKQHRRWAFPLIVVGMNSIAAYLIAHLFVDFISSSFLINFGHGLFTIFGQALEPLLLGGMVLATYWLILFWMYRRQLFIKI